VCARVCTFVCELAFACTLMRMVFANACVLAHLRVYIYKCMRDHAHALLQICVFVWHCIFVKQGLQETAVM